MHPMVAKEYILISQYVEKTRNMTEKKSLNYLHIVELT